MLLLIVILNNSYSSFSGNKVQIKISDIYIKKYPFNEHETVSCSR